MDFRTPERGRYLDPRPVQRAPVATVPPPQPVEPGREQPAKDEPKPKRRLRRKPAANTGGRSWKKLALAVVIIGLVTWLGYEYITTKNQLEQAKNSPKTAGQTATQQLVGKVGALADLPAGETPTIATVSDAAKLKTQQFFANAQDGDKVLIYSKAGKAVLYRPSTNRVIEYSKVNLGNSQ